MQPSEKADSSPASTGVERRHTCDICQHSFQFQYELKHHRVVHVPKNLRARYPCNQCPKQFVSRKGLKLHLRMHEGAGLKCQDCGKRFATRWYLDTHRRVHTGEKPFACGECGRRFSQRANMVRHANTHQTKDERHTFSCEVCDREFLRHDSLISHRTVTHGLAASKPHVQPTRPRAAAPAPATDRASAAVCQSSFAAPIPRISIPMSSPRDELSCSTTSLRAPQRLHCALGGPNADPMGAQDPSRPILPPFGFSTSPSPSEPVSPASTASRSPSISLFGSSDLHDHQRLQLQQEQHGAAAGKTFPTPQTPDTHQTAVSDPYSFLSDDQEPHEPHRDFDPFAGGDVSRPNAAPLPSGLVPLPSQPTQAPESPMPTHRCNCGFDADLRGNYCGGCGTILRASSSRVAFYLRPGMVM